MLSSFVRRQVTIGDAAAFVGTTPRAIRHYHDIGLLPEPERGSDNRRRYGYDDVLRLLWIRKTADAGIALDDVRDAFTDAPDRSDGDHAVQSVLERLEATLAAQEAELRRQRTAVQRMRRRGPRSGLLSDVVAARLEGLPEGSLRRTDLDALLITERIFGPLGAAVQASRFIALATRDDLREQEDRLDAAEEALDDTVAVDDPRVARVAGQRHAFELALHAVIEESGLADAEEELFDSWDALHPAGVDDGPDATGGSRGRRSSPSATDAVRNLPHDWSPARRRCMELVLELSTRE
ncbi:MerR family transcriptional regulator [Kineococcus sp. NBC_00420]|uniref:MerR family transcriptional regulator n=1 Tax=unclassified Kineococcus TaxID=2621656 RepID=UPI002E1D957E